MFIASQAGGESLLEPCPTLHSDWLARSPHNGSIDYVRIAVGDLNCGRPNAGTGTDSEKTLIVHHLKTALAHRYVWDMLRHGVAHSQPNCSYWCADTEAERRQSLKLLKQLERVREPVEAVPG